MALPYPTFDHLPDLTPSQMNAAARLSFERLDYAGAVPWDNYAAYLSRQPYAILRDTFVWTGQAGATYDIVTESYHEPFLLTLYDQYGNTIAAEYDGEDDGQIWLWDWQAPYTGTYYVSAGWHQGEESNDPWVWLAIYEDVDTIPSQPSQPGQPGAGFQLIDVYGTAGNDWLIGTDAQEAFWARPGDDVIEGRGGNDVIYGSAGIDTAVFRGLKSEYQISGPIRDTRSVTDKVAGRDGSDTLELVERLQFADARVAVDLDGHAGVVVKILGAVLGASAATDKELVGIGLQLADAGVEPWLLASLAIDYRLGPNASHAAVVDLLYTNIVGQHPTARDAAPFLDMLNQGMHVGALGWLAADTPLNQQNIDLAGLTATGVEYWL